MSGSRGEQYKRIRLLGKGAFAEVYLVEDCIGRVYACKVCGRPEMLEREAALQKSAVHSLFPEVYDFRREEAKGCLLMEYVRGESLETILRREGSFREERAAAVGVRLAEGLKYLHEREEPLIFRDVKPSNVMLTPEGDVKLLDFGCACPPGRQADRAGTPGFGAPEQFEPGGLQTAAADIYGLGRTLQVMLGQGSGLLKKIADRCTARNPEERLPDMRETAELLRLCTGEAEGRMSARQKAVLKGKIRVVKDICVS
ncbi:MAG: serine/threonine protein kinase [Butyrivibrio sp.]|nr:serine/threonine protein kinase [Acetatifactor muris]MCM1559085.1 serine/threonine protein kinase [Butyrivibrio sp.]